MLASLHLDERAHVEAMVLGISQGHYISLTVGRLTVYLAGFDAQCAEQALRIAEALTKAATEITEALKTDGQSREPEVGEARSAEREAVAVAETEEAPAGVGEVVNDVF